MSIPVRKNELNLLNNLNNNGNFNEYHNGSNKIILEGIKNMDNNSKIFMYVF